MLLFPVTLISTVERQILLHCSINSFWRCRPCQVSLSDANTPPLYHCQCWSPQAWMIVVIKKLPHLTWGWLIGLPPLRSTVYSQLVESKLCTETTCRATERFSVVWYQLLVAASSQMLPSFFFTPNYLSNLHTKSPTGFSCGLWLTTN